MTVGLFLALNLTLSAAQFYILFDASCMDRLEYNYNRPDGKGDYLVYHVNIKSGEKLVLEIGTESANEQNYLPTPNLSCNSGGFDQGLMRRINANIDEVFLVYQKNAQKYVVSPIVNAAFYTKTGTVISYDSPKYRFRFDTEYGTIGENIAINNPGAKVYFEGRMENDCTGAYLFRQLSPQSAYPLIDLTVSPEIGIIEERSGANAAVAMNNKLVLNRVNGKSLDRYLQEVCGTEPGSSGSVVSAAALNTMPNSYYAGGATINPSPMNLPAGAILPGGQLANPTPTTAPATIAAAPVFTATTPTATLPAATPPTHTVAAGETLYGIAKANNISVNDLKSWNGLSSNVIRRGKVLQLAPPTNSTAPETTSGFIAAKGGNSSGTTLSGTPAPYGPTDSQRIMTADDTKIHIVKPGETLSSIALEYGYTAKRFREMNDLGTSDYVKVGQRLRTTDCECPPASASVSNTGTLAPSVPNSFENTGGRLSPGDLTARTPFTSNQPLITTNNSGLLVRNTGGLPATAVPVPSVPVTTVDSRYNAVVPPAYDAPAPQRSLSSVEQVQNRAIGNTTDFGSPVSTSPAAKASPFPTPNAPLQSSQLAQQPDSYSQSSSNQRRVHIVASGESLYGISRRYNTTPDRLRQLNNLGPNDPILEFQRLYIE